VGSVFAFPMWIGRIAIGSVGLYAGGPSALPSRSIARASALARSTAGAVLDRAVRVARPERPGEWSPDGYARREIHQAVGMIAAQTGGSTADAMLLLRAAAFASARSVRDVSIDVVRRDLDLGGQHDPGTPERNQ